MIGHLDTIVIDCPDPRGLAGFYSGLLGMPVAEADDDWATIRPASGGVGVAFQRVAEYTPPQWPDPGHPQQLHLDVRVDDVDAAESEVLALGARRLPGEGKDFRVYADPAGHPFCLIW